MKVFLTLEHRFSRTPDGAVWSTMFPNAIWQRYLGVFDEIELVARVRDVPAVDEKFKRVDGAGVRFRGLPYYHGPQQYLAKWLPFRRALLALAEEGAPVIVRVPSNLAAILVPRLVARGLPYAIEAVADPWDNFSPGTTPHPLRPLFRRLYAGRMQRHCRAASAALYVTERALQRRYPTVAGRFSAGVSDVDLPENAFVPQPRDAASFRTAAPFRLVCVGNFNLLYKAQDVLVQAFAKIAAERPQLELAFAGDGVHLPHVRALAAQLGVAERVKFLGLISGGAGVRGVLDGAHLFVLPSRQEGLPRAMVEAMARALPCVASEVGGHSELIDPSLLVPAGDVEALAQKLHAVTGDPAQLARLSAANLERARDFRDALLQPRREEFLRTYREIFEWWKSESTPAARRELMAPVAG
jgi:glycosyltransferase involved in cell wall biosynthesis